MSKQKKIFMYSSFPLVEADTYFNKNLIKPITFTKTVDKTTYLPSTSGFPKLYLLKIEHELSLKESVSIYSSFLKEEDYECIFEIADKFDAEIEYIFMQSHMEDLYEVYRKKSGPLSFDEFCDKYAEYYHVPVNVDLVSFVQI